MKKIIFICMLIFMVSCGGSYIDKPKNLVSKDQMAQILADLTINDQATFMYPNANLEAGTRYVLKSHNVKPQDFIDSFKYYVIKEKMNGIAEEAQRIVLEKDPKADQYVKDELKKNGNIPNITR
ncbi:DUF4296 domain-containing protein [Chryseobacterium sp. SSA4.19]|uniref:DUF4296 domain-containing protein n=1 Tax=Chryseobacterium sp. SSA4.19 TaxID=2919915 RepID=UPI001F4E8CCB|nr:DUF4296 domain-containing protein [Chryseobacterium sp. SSA4.19]MCJ8152587.1 DUF4296 domain-containing protein [Chryseobacterium sp. SSA4.19]